MGSDEGPWDAYIEQEMDRITDATMVEHRLLELAYTTDAKITVTALAYFAPCSIDLASRVLDDMVAHDRLSMEVEDDGTIAYHLPGRQRIAMPHAQTMAHAQTALVPMAAPHREASPMVAALLIDPERRAAMGRRGREEVVQRYSEAVVGKLVHDFYEGLL